MSDFQPALEYTLHFEDPEGQYAVSPDTCPEGCAGPCFAIAGINSGVWPRDYLDIAALPQGSRSSAVAQFYLDNYWNPMQLAALNSQDLANRVFDEGVDNGQQTAIRLLQGAANALGGSLTVDGGMGPLTIAAVNAIDSVLMLAAYRHEREDRYKDIVAANPADAKYLAGWLVRASA